VARSNFKLKKVLNLDY